MNFNYWLICFKLRYKYVGLPWWLGGSNDISQVNKIHQMRTCVFPKWWMFKWEVGYGGILWGGRLLSTYACKVTLILKKNTSLTCWGVLLNCSKWFAVFCRQLSIWEVSTIYRVKSTSWPDNPEWFFLLNNLFISVPLNKPNLIIAMWF